MGRDFGIYRVKIADYFLFMYQGVILAIPSNSREHVMISFVHVQDWRNLVPSRLF